MASTADADLAASRAHTATDAPAMAQPSAKPSPMPPLPPVNDGDLSAEVMVHGAGGFWPVMVQ